MTPLKEKRKRYRTKVISIFLSIVLITGLILYPSKPHAEPTEAAYALQPGDLTLEQLAGRVLPEEDIPDVMWLSDIQEKDHANRLREQETDLNSILFQNRTGNKTMYYFDTPVKYIDKNGVVRDKSNKITDQIDNPVYQDNYKFVNADNDIRTYFPKTLQSKTGIILEKENIKIEISPVSVTGRNKTAYKSEAVTPSKTKKTAAIKDWKKAYDVVEYSGVFGNGTILRYTPQFDGYKEDIILNEYTGVNQFRFRIQTNGLSLIQEEGRCYFVDPQTGDTLAHIGEILVHDSSEQDSMQKGTALFGEQNVQHQYELQMVKEDNEYILTIVVNEEYLKDENRVWPVTVDPTITINTSGSGSSKTIEDAPIYQNSSVANGGNNWDQIGMTSLGKGRLLMKFPGLMDNFTFQYLDASQITNLSLHMRESSGQSTSTTIRAYRYIGPDWVENTVKYSSQIWNGAGPISGNGTVATPIDSKTFGSYNAMTVTFNLTGMVSVWKSNESAARNKGIILQNSNESSTSSRKDFRSTEYSDAGTRPYLTLDFTIGSTKSFPNGMYFIRNVRTGQYLDVENAGTTSGSNVITFPFNGSAAQQWKITYTSDGYYTLQPACAPQLYLDVLGGIEQNRTNVQIHDGTVNNNKQFRFHLAAGVSDGSVIIRPKFTETHVLDGYAEEVTVGSQTGRNVHLWKYPITNTQQRWVLEPIPSISRSYLSLKPNETETISASAASSGLSITWSTSNSNVATINNGVISAKAAGYARITATTIYGHKISCHVFVEELAYIVNEATGTRLDVYGESYDNNARVCTWGGFTAQANQTWAFERQSNGYYKIRPLHTNNRVLKYQNGSALSCADSNDDNVLWNLTLLSKYTTGGNLVSICTYRISPKANPSLFLCADTDAHGKNVQLLNVPSSNTKSQWTITPTVSLNIWEGTIKAIYPSAGSKPRKVYYTVDSNAVTSHLTDDIYRAALEWNGILPNIDMVYVPPGQTPPSDRTLFVTFKNDSSVSLGRTMPVVNGVLVKDPELIDLAQDWDRVEIHLNVSNFAALREDVVKKAVIMHEFGHALKLAHNREESDNGGHQPDYAASFPALMQRGISPSKSADTSADAYGGFCSWHITSFDRSAFLKKWGSQLMANEN